MKGADLDIQNKNGDTALIRACEYGHLEVVKLLIENGAELNMQEEGDGDTALILACRRGHLEIAKLLIKKGADIHKQDKRGNTALILAVKNNNIETCKVLLSHIIILPSLKRGENEFSAPFFLLILNKVNSKIPKDIKKLLALYLELPQSVHFLTNIGCPALVKQVFLSRIDEIVEYTIEKLTPMMVTAREKTQNQELKELLNPELYKVNFGQNLRENIKNTIEENNLHLFVKRASDNSTKDKS